MPFLLAGISVLPWSLVMIYLFPVKNFKKIAIIAGFSLLAGHLTTQLLLIIHPFFWPKTGMTVKNSHILTQTAHIAFIQAGMLEETVKIFFIMLISWFFARKNSLWTKEVVIAGSFVALGFALTENTLYFSSAETELLFSTFVARMIHSVNIHMLINLCFALFLMKSNQKTEKLVYTGFAFGLAVFQHGVVDFFLLPGSKIGNWLAAAMFCGIWVWVVTDYRRYIIPQKQ